MHHVSPKSTRYLSKQTNTELCFSGYLEVILILALEHSSSVTDSGANKQILDSGGQINKVKSKIVLQKKNSWIDIILNDLYV